MANPVIMGAYVLAYELRFWDERGKQTNKQTYELQ